MGFGCKLAHKIELIIKVLNAPSLSKRRARAPCHYGALE